MPEPELLVEKTDGTAVLTLNRPAAMNALSRSLRRAIVAAMREIETDPDVGVVVLTGAGRAFCAGLDLKELGGETGGDGDIGGAIGGDAGVTDAISRCTRPVIGAVNGVAVTGGFELALACDVLIASTDARFADTHARVGILPGWGLSQKLSRAIGIYRAKHLSLTGNYLSAADAAAWGLVSAVVPPGDLLPAARRLAQDMLSCDPETLRGYKRVIDAGFAQTFGDGLRTEAEANRAHARTLTPEKIAARRSAVQARGRAQVQEG
ncbi:MAG: enoyl-CoA hydratase [bacterium]|nr:enoyl-CoA hydratase [bacterium]